MSSVAVAVRVRHAGARARQPLVVLDARAPQLQPAARGLRRAQPQGHHHPVRDGEAGRRQQYVFDENTIDVPQVSSQNERSLYIPPPSWPNVIWVA